MSIMVITKILVTIIVVFKRYFIIKVSILWAIIIEEFVVSVIKIFIIVEFQVVG